MGITADNLFWFASWMAKADGPGRRMLELGNQTLHVGLTRPAKVHFKAAGWHHVSVDLNGEDGALALDLCQPHLFLGSPFDVATDFGTSEHVADLWQCLSNIHENTRPGGLIFHANPEPGSWPGHGFHYRGQNFWKVYAHLCDYDVLQIDRAAACGNTTDGWETRAILRRGNAPFISREDFAVLPVELK